MIVSMRSINERGLSRERAVSLVRKRRSASEVLRKDIAARLHISTRYKIITEAWLQGVPQVGLTCIQHVHDCT